MATRTPLGIKKIEALQYYVHDLERTRRFLVDKLDFVETGVSGPELEQAGRTHSAVFKAGDVTFVVAQPRGEARSASPSEGAEGPPGEARSASRSEGAEGPPRDGGRAWRWLKKHPEGVGTIVFEVEEIERAFRLLDERGGTFITDITRYSDDHGSLAMFNITTPFGDTTFRFVERKGYALQFPGFVPHASVPAGNRFGFGQVDHVTANFQTMQPMLLWMEHVLGFERMWTVQFHTTDIAGKDAVKGSGLKSVVMWDPTSGVKFANNEPFRPFFKESQINLFSEDHHGDGVQHTALTVPDVISTVRGLRQRGVEFMQTPGAYYDMLPARLEKIGVGQIDEKIDELRELEILVDGEEAHQYLLQIFLKEAAGLYHDPEAGPFFFEIIQRKGSRGFGAGNFRALFESIERQQRLAGRIS